MPLKSSKGRGCYNCNPSTDRNGPEGPLSQEPVTHEVVLQDQIAPACDFYARGDNN